MSAPHVTRLQGAPFIPGPAATASFNLTGGRVSDLLRWAPDGDYLVTYPGPVEVKYTVENGLTRRANETSDARTESQD